MQKLKSNKSFELIYTFPLSGKWSSSAWEESPSRGGKSPSRGRKTPILKSPLPCITFKLGKGYRNKLKQKIQVEPCRPSGNSCSQTGPKCNTPYSFGYFWSGQRGKGCNIGRAPIPPRSLTIKRQFGPKRVLPLFHKIN